MKKNTIMRIASVLMVLTLISTCAISGTFAKYVTSADGSDSARVAKWGVAVTVTSPSDTFKTTYAPKETTTGVTNAVNATSEDLVAPGTSGSFEFSITGTPEVAVSVAITLKNGDDSFSMIKVPTTSATAADAEISADYYPVKWTLKNKETSEGEYSVVSSLENVTLEAINTYLTGDSVSKNNDANTNLTETYGYYELSWAWTFETNDNTNKIDTYLGNVMAGTATDTNVVTTEKFALAITVTQID